MNDCLPIATTDLPKTTDLRKSPRVYCRLPVQLRTTDDRTFEADCTDVGLGGIGLDSRSVLAVGQRVDLLVNRTAFVPMIVIYRMGDHYGLSSIAAHELLMHLLPKQ